MYHKALFHINKLDTLKSGFSITYLKRKIAKQVDRSASPGGGGVNPEKEKFLGGGQTKCTNDLFFAHTI